MKKTICLLFVLTAAAAAEMWIPEGTPVRVRLGVDLSRATAKAAAQPVEFSVIEEVRIQGKVVINVGAQAMGTYATGEQDDNAVIAIDRVRAVDGSWVALRYAAKKNAGSTLVRTDQQKDRASDPDLLLPRGATFALFIDETKTTASIIPSEETKQYPNILQWLVGEMDPASIWPQRYSTALSVAGCLLILLGLIHQRRENRQI